VKVTVKGLPKDTLCHLAYYFGDKQYLIDSAKVDANGTVSFSADTLVPAGIYLFVLPDKKFFEMLLDKEQRFSMQTDPADFIRHMKIDGSPENKVFYEYLVFINERSQEMNALRQRFEAAADPAAKEKIQAEMNALNEKVIERKNAFIAANPGSLMASVFEASREVEMPAEKPLNPDGSLDSLAWYYYYKNHFFDHIDLADNRLVRTPVLFPKIEQWVQNLTPQIPDSVIAAADFIIQKSRTSPDIFKFLVWWISNQYETSKIMGMDAVFVHMAKNYYTREQAFWADSSTIEKIQERARVLDPILLGRPMRPMVLKDTAGVYRSLHDVKKPWTVLLIWDPDCGHCKTAVPKMKALYDKAKPHGVEVFAVNNEAEHEKWIKFIREHDLNWINVADMDFKNNFRYELDVKTTPQIFLLDAEKKIAAKRIDVYTLSEILEDKLGVPLKIPRDKSAEGEGDGHAAH
jgi:peroxiredoxin